MAEENLARQAELALERQGDHDSVFFEGRWHSAGSLADRAARLATGLADLGVRPGDRLVVLMANCPEVLITYSAAWRAGAVVTPLIFLVSEDELRNALVDSGAVGVVTTAEFLPKVAAALVGAPSARFVLVPGAPGGPAAPGVPVLDFAQVEAAEPGSIVDRSGTDLAALLFTGGTTGRSKGVPLTHANLFWCGWAANQNSARFNLNTALVPLPLTHASVLAGGWLHTGDIGHLDADGYLYVVDRKKDLILRGGFNIFPRDVEDVLVAHPAVALAGVVGRPDVRLGEEVVAFVSLRPGAVVTAEELSEHARKHLGANKYPRQITIVHAVPLTSVGKLDRKKLRQWAADGPPQ
jgi:acyl-CoA synthetase (AMP-forming)/AMP-acid ligase II